MAILLSPVVYGVRAGPKCFDWGDPYTSTGLVVANHNIAVVQAWTVPMNYWLGLKQLLRDEGFEFVEWNHNGRVVRRKL